MLLFLDMSNDDSLAEDHGLDLFLNLIFLKDASMFTTERNVFAKKINKKPKANLASRILEVQRISLSQVTEKSLFIKVSFSYCLR